MADPEARLADIAAVMDAAGLAHAALFATADGAIPAILFAARHPERVDALIVLEGTARWLAADDVLMPVGQRRAIATGTTGGRFVELPGADHFHWFTKADRIAADTEEVLTGRRGGAGGARCLSSVLFTDIVESTVRAGELG